MGSIKVDFGTVMVALHAEASAETFPDVKGAVAAQWARAASSLLLCRRAGSQLRCSTTGTATCELDTDILGILKEGYGFSRNTKGSFGPPRFADVDVEVPAGVGAVRMATDLTYRED